MATHRPDDEIVALPPGELYGGDKDIFDEILTMNKSIYTTDGRASPQEQQNVYQQLLDAGRLNTIQLINLKDIFIAEFLGKANE